MPNENLESTAVLEKPAQPETLEFTGKHLEAAFTFRANYHKQRILEKFGGVDELPALPVGNAAELAVESEKQYQKASDLLYREIPVDLPDPNPSITRELIIAIADNLAWHGIENAIATDQLELIQILQERLAHSTHSSRFEAVQRMKDRAKELKVLAVADNHYFRDFFDSSIAATLKLDSPIAMRKFLSKSNLAERQRSPLINVARGLSLEVATKNCVTDYLYEREEQGSISFGNSEQDKYGGDIVVVRGESILFIDIKSKKPRGLSPDSISQGYDLKVDKRDGIFKAIAWAHSPEPVAEHSFILTDQKLEEVLGEILEKTS